MFTLGNILHGGIVDMTDRGSNNLLLATGQIVDVAMHDIFFGAVQCRAKWLVQPQLK
jgi:hypothetical protein